MQEENIKQITYSNQLKEGANNRTEQDSPLISSNKTATLSMLDSPQKLWSSMQNLEQSLNTSMARGSIGDALTSSSNPDSLVSAQDSITSFQYDKQNLNQQNTASTEATLTAEKLLSPTVLTCDKIC